MCRISKIVFVLVSIHLEIFALVEAEDRRENTGVNLPLLQKLHPQPVDSSEHVNHIENAYNGKGPSQYGFGWLVNDQYSGNDFGHEQATIGHDTKGSYYVLLPDGRTQHVNYYVNGNSGFVADVTYEGEAVYPAPLPENLQIYDQTGDPSRPLPFGYDPVIPANLYQVENRAFNTLGSQEIVQAY